MLPAFLFRSCLQSFSLLSLSPFGSIFCETTQFTLVYPTKLVNCVGSPSLPGLSSKRFHYLSSHIFHKVKLQLPFLLRLTYQRIDFRRSEENWVFWLQSSWKVLWSIRDTLFDDVNQSPLELKAPKIRCQFWLRAKKKVSSRQKSWDCNSSPPH